MPIVNRMANKVKKHSNRHIEIDRRNCWQILLGVLMFFLLPWFTGLVFGAGAMWYATPAGAGDNSGKTWANALAGISGVNDSVTASDSCQLGTGIYRGTMLDPVAGAVYYCSSWVKGIAEIHGGDSIDAATWQVHDTTGAERIWKTSYDKDPVPAWFGGSVRLCSQVDGSHDTMLYMGAVIPTAAGYFYHNETVESLYVWLHGNADPDTVKIITAKVPGVGFSGEDGVKIWGIRFLWCRGGSVVWRGDYRSDSNHIEHCYFRGVGGIENVGHLFSSTSSPVNDSTVVTGWGNVIRACSSNGLVYVADEGDASQHAYGMGFYSMWGTVIESCTVIDDGTLSKGIKFKSDAWHDTIRHNVIKMLGGDDCIRFTADYRDCTIYGNTLIGNNAVSTGIALESQSADTTLVCGYVYIYNNTIVETNNSGLHTWLDNEEGHRGEIIFKYNIIYKVVNGSTVGMVSVLDGDTTYYSADSNMYYVDTGDSLFRTADGTKTMAQLNSQYGWETHSNLGVDPGFADADNDDYTPSSAMVISPVHVIASDTFSNAGAIQNSAAPAITKRGMFLK